MLHFSVNNFSKKYNFFSDTSPAITAESSPPHIARGLIVRLEEVKIWKPE